MGPLTATSAATCDAWAWARRGAACGVGPGLSGEGAGSGVRRQAVVHGAAGPGSTLWRRRVGA